MSIQDFLEEAKKRTGGGRLSPARQEVHAFAMTVYHDIKGGYTEKWVKQVSKMLVQSIAPNLSTADTFQASATVEGIAITVLAELFESGTLVKKEDYKDEA
jgi:hypothetical protein